MLEFNHDELVKALALRIESDDRYGLVKFFTPANDTKTDVVGAFYPDVTALRREGRQKIMIEVQTPFSFEDIDEVRRLQGLSNYCATHGWEFYLACPDDRTIELTQKKIDGQGIKPKAIWRLDEVPFSEFKAKAVND